MVLADISLTMLLLAGKAKAPAAQASELLSADADSKTAAPSATAPSHQAHQASGYPNPESLSTDTAQPTTAPQESAHKSFNGVSTSQSDLLSDPVDRDGSSPAGTNRTPHRPESLAINNSQQQTAPKAPVQYLPPAGQSPAPSSLASSPMQSPRPRSAASEAESVPVAATTSSGQSSRAQSPSVQYRPPQSHSSQQAFSQQLRAALTSPGKPPAQTHRDPSPQKQATQSPTGQINGLPGSAVHSPAAQDPSAFPRDSSAGHPASSSRPGSVNPSQPPSVMSDMTNAMVRPSPASPGPRPGYAPSRQPDSSTTSTGHSPRPTAPGSQQLADRRAAAAAAAAAALTGPPKAASHVPQLRLSSVPSSHNSPVPSARAASPFEQAAAALAPLAAAGKGKQGSSADAWPAAARALSPSSPHADAAVPTSPPVTTPVRKPPGLPSPVPAAHDQGSADLDSVISSDRWPDQVSGKSETSSNPRSPKKKAIKVPAVVAPLPPPTASASAAVSEALSDTASDEGSSLGERQSISSSQPLDQSAAAIAARLEKERAQQLKQEAKHLASKQRAAARERQRIAEQDRRQQEEHAARKAARARQKAEREGLTGPSLHPPVGGFREPHDIDRPHRAPRDYDDAPPQQAPKSYPLGQTHTPKAQARLACLSAAMSLMQRLISCLGYLSHLLHQQPAS